MSNMAINRLTREFKKLELNPVENILALPDPKNIFEWSFLIYGLKDSQYTGGFYHGKIIFPVEYPHKPPKIVFITPSGRFKTNEPICLSFTNFHPESWNPSWTIETMLVGLISFMNSTDITKGSINTSDGTKRGFAKKSLMFNLDNEEFVRIFKSRFEQLGINEEKARENFEKGHVEAEANGSHSEGTPAIGEDEAKKSLFLMASIIAILAGYLLLKTVFSK